MTQSTILVCVLIVQGVQYTYVDIGRDLVLYLYLHRVHADTPGYRLLESIMIDSRPLVSSLIIYT